MTMQKTQKDNLLSKKETIMSNLCITKFVFICFASMVFMTGCTHNIPVSMNLQIQKPSESKIQKKILVVMNKEQSEMLIRKKPGTFSDTFEFEAGKSISTNLVTAMKAMFEAVDFANEYPSGQGGFDYYLTAQLADHKLDWGSNVFSDWKYDVHINYELLDSSRKPLLAVPTDGSSKNMITTGETGSIIASGIAVWILTPFVPIKAASIAGLSGAGRGYSVIGRTWDDAVADSITQLMNKLDNYFKGASPKQVYNNP
jgi:hypothetical protein